MATGAPVTLMRCLVCTSSSHIDPFQGLLQAANVHAILESGPAVAGVAERLHHATSLLDDFEQNLTIFDIKLRHMREDIAAIEARNNSLELQARNNTKLLGKLESAILF